MKLAVNNFFDYRPASQWAFDIAFSDVCMLSSKADSNGKYQPLATGAFSNEDLLRIKQSVVSVSQPKFDINADTKCYGNFDFVTPIYDANNIRLTVTFEDTDDCLISFRLLSALCGNMFANKNVPMWLNVHAGMYIRLYEYDTYTLDIARPNTEESQANNYNTTSVKYYYCKLIQFTEPQYSRSSDKPSAATLQLTFLAVPIASYMVDVRKVIATEPEVLDAKAIFDTFWQNSNALVDKLGKFVSDIQQKFISFISNANIKDYAQQAAAWAKEKYGAARPTMAMLAEWATTLKYDDGNAVFDNTAKHQCAMGPSFLQTILESYDDESITSYRKHGNGNTWNINGDRGTAHTYTEVETIVQNLKPGESVVLSFSNVTGASKQSELYGHAMVVARTQSGELIKLSDFNQKSWQTYDNAASMPNLKINVIRPDNHTRHS